jgi:hypothetical protein
MKSLLTAVVAFSCIAFFSCQKEVDDTLPGNTPSANVPGLLKRMVIKQNSDSSVSDFFYNSAGKLLAVRNTDVSGGTSEYSNQTVERNSQGMIQKVITKGTQLSQNGIDSLVSIVRSVSGRYTNRVVKAVVLGDTTSDSTVYTYNASGSISSQEDYIDDGTGGLIRIRAEYTYSGGNLVSLKGYDLTSGTPVLNLNQVLEYDARTSPLVVGNEAFVLDNFLEWYSGNNLKKLTVNETGDPVTHVETLDYLYNSANKPASAIIIPDGQLGITASYYYY